MIIIYMVDTCTLSKYFHGVVMRKVQAQMNQLSLSMIPLLLPVFLSSVLVIWRATFLVHTVHVQSSIESILVTAR